MQLCNCLVALSGDLNNKGVMQNVTPGEIETLRMIHGQGAVTDVEIVGRLQPHEYSHEDVYRQLRFKYPLYEHLIQNYWRDRGANLPIDVREIGLPESAFRMPPDMMVERLTGDTPKVAKPPRKNGKAVLQPAEPQQIADEPEELEGI